MVNMENIKIIDRKKNYNIFFYFIFSGSHSDVCFALKDAVGDDLEYQCTDDAKYCPEVPFNFAFGILIVQWIMLPFTCCCGMMSCMFSMCKQTSQSANVETAWKN